MIVNISFLEGEHILICQKDVAHDRHIPRVSMGYSERSPHLKHLLMTSTLPPDCRLLQE
jgi:hypothetical protein